MYSVKNLFEKHGEQLKMELITGKKGLDRPILVPEANRPGLSLSGYLKWYANKRILI